MADHGALATLLDQADEETLALHFLQYLCECISNDSDPVSKTASVLDACYKGTEWSTIEQDVERLQLPPRPDMSVAIHQGLPHAMQALTRTVLYHANTERPLDGDGDTWKLRSLCIFVNVKLFKDSYLNDVEVNDATNFEELLRGLVPTPPTVQPAATPRPTTADDVVLFARRVLDRRISTVREATVCLQLIMDTAKLFYVQHNIDFSVIEIMPRSSDIGGTLDAIVNFQGSFNHMLRTGVPLDDLVDILFAFTKVELQFLGMVVD
jgi:hypothetical protein